MCLACGNVSMLPFFSLVNKDDKDRPDEFTSLSGVRIKGANDQLV